MVTIGSIMVYHGWWLIGQLVVIGLLVANGLFLSFRVSPYLIARERDGRSAKTLTSKWQQKIMVSMILSDIGWWGSVVALGLYLVGETG